MWPVVFGCLALACLALALSAPPAANAASGWLSPVNLAEETQEVQFGPYVAMDAQGDALAAWSGYDGRNEALEQAGGSWEPPGSLAGEGQEVEHPCVAMSSGGEGLALWAAAKATGNGKGELVIEAASKPAGGDWQAPVTVAEKLSPRALVMRDCDVAIDPAGDAVAVWSYETEFEFQPVWAAYRPAGGDWQAPVELAPPSNPQSAPDVAIDADGNAQAVWIGSSFVIQGAYKPAGEDWQKPESVTEAESLSEKGHSASDPQVAFDAQGDAIAAWDLYDGENEVVQAASRSYGGAWQTPVDLSEAGQSAYVPSVAMDSAGDALAMWDLYSGEHRVVQVAARPGGGEWQAPVDLSAADEDAYSPALAMDSEGDAVAAWELQSGSSWTVQSAVKPHGGEWQAPIAVSAATEYGELFPQVAIDSHGDALAAWELDNGTSYLVQAAGYQATSAPELPELGRCVKLGRGAKGRYKTAACTTTSAGEDTGKYEWQPWPAANSHFSADGAAVKLETTGRTSVKCAKSAYTGEYTGPQTAALSLTFTGCEAAGGLTGQCRSDGASAGEIKTNTLDGQLGVIAAQARPSIGWDLQPASEPDLATFECGERVASLTGSVIVPVSGVDKMTAAFKLKFKASKGKQVPEQLEGGTRDTLSLLVAGAEEQAGLTMSDSLADEEPLEIKALL